MRTKSWSWLLPLGGLWLSGCGARAYEGGDSNSNWLKSCEPGVECGSGLECLCGVRAVECSSDSACSRGIAAVCEYPRVAVAQPPYACRLPSPTTTAPVQ